MKVQYLTFLVAGEPYGIRVIAPSEARRIEAGIFNYGSDMRVEDTPRPLHYRYAAAST